MLLTSKDNFSLCRSSSGFSVFQQYHNFFWHPVMMTRHTGMNWFRSSPRPSSTVVSYKSWARLCDISYRRTALELSHHFTMKQFQLFALLVIVLALFSTGMHYYYLPSLFTETDSSGFIFTFSSELHVIWRKWSSISKTGSCTSNWPRLWWGLELWWIFWAWMWSGAWKVPLFSMLLPSQWMWKFNFPLQFVPRM